MNAPVDLALRDPAPTVEPADPDLTPPSAGNAAEAIRLLELHDEITLIFTDIKMPGSVDGLALAHYVRGRWPPVKILLLRAIRR
jgi:two-component system, response regulator PdtaR